MRRANRAARLAPVLAVAAVMWLAASAAPALAQSSDLDRRVREIAAELRCPVCQNLSVADSPSPLAAEMRTAIRQKLESGQSREEIISYFVERYGEEVLLNPPQQGFTLLVWLGAALGVVGGLGLLAMRVRRALINQAPPAVPAAFGPPLAPGEQDRYEAVLDAELARYKGSTR